MPAAFVRGPREFNSVHSRWQEGAMRKTRLEYVRPRSNADFAERFGELLSNNQSMMTQVARDSGFGSPSQFATIFRRVEGMTPSDYLRNL